MQQVSAPIAGGARLVSGQLLLFANLPPPQ